MSKRDYYEVLGVSKSADNKDIKKAEKILNDDSIYDRMSKAHNPYGDGLACQRISDVLMREIS